MTGSQDIVTEDVNQDGQGTRVFRVSMLLIKFLDKMGTYLRFLKDVKNKM